MNHYYQYKSDASRHFKTATIFGLLTLLFAFIAVVSFCDKAIVASGLCAGFATVCVLGFADCFRDYRIASRNAKLTRPRRTDYL